MSSDDPDEPKDRSPEELAALLADLAAETQQPENAVGAAAWRPASGPPPEIWAAPEDPLDHLHQEVSELEARSPGPARPLRPVSDQPPAAAPPLERVGHVPGAWSTLRATRQTASTPPPRAKLLTGVIAAARERRARRKTD